MECWEEMKRGGGETERYSERERENERRDILMILHSCVLRGFYCSWCFGLRGSMQQRKLPMPPPRPRNLGAFCFS